MCGPLKLHNFCKRKNIKNMTWAFPEANIIPHPARSAQTNLTQINFSNHVHRIKWDSCLPKHAAVGSNTFQFPMDDQSTDLCHPPIANSLHKHNQYSNIQIPTKPIKSKVPIKPIKSKNIIIHKRTVRKKKKSQNPNVQSR